MKTMLCKSGDDIRIGVLKALTALACAVVVQALLSTTKVEMPQKKGESLLSLISDDTRMVVSASMMQKADEYFHGGVKVVETTLEAHAAEALGGENHHHDHDHDHHDHDHSDHRVSFHTALKNPFIWINSQVHAQEHRHMEYERSVELLPWVSAAVMASPHNIQAYESGSYILHRMADKPDLAIQFLNQGITNNPDNVSLEFALSELYFNRLKDRKNAAVHLKYALKKSLAIKGELSDDDLFDRLKIYFYLGVIARDNHDASRLSSICQRAYELNPDSKMTQSLERWLREMQNKPKE